MWKPVRAAMRNRLVPRTQSIMSRAWALYVNEIAASSLVKRPTRIAIYRRCGLEVETERIYPRCYFHTANVWLGPDVILNHGVHLENVARIEIGARTGLGIHSVVLTSNHEMGPRELRHGKWTPQPVTIGEGCWIGARSLILPGVTIGDGCVVAAGAVVTRDLEPDGVYVGVPARRIRDLDADGRFLDGDARVAR